MAYPSHEERHAARENEILDAAQSLIYSKGYEQMTIQDLLDALQISKGAFYHYFSSKQALLEALIARMVEQMMAVLRPIVDDADMAALPKLEAIFRTAAGWKSARIEFLAALVQVWYADENVLLRDKFSRAMLERFRELLQAVIEQGIAEGVMSTDYPDLAGGIAMDLLMSASIDIAHCLMHWDQLNDAPQRVERAIAAYTQAIERVLRVRDGSIHLMDPSIFGVWGDAFAAQRLRLAGDGPKPVPQGERR